MVLLTSATGIVRKVVLAKLRRRRETLGVERVLALVRAKNPQADRRAAAQRGTRLAVLRGGGAGLREVDRGGRRRLFAVLRRNSTFRLQALLTAAERFWQSPCRPDISDYA